jgi:hypothetical protein
MKYAARCCLAGLHTAYLLHLVVCADFTSMCPKAVGETAHRRVDQVSSQVSGLHCSHHAPDVGHSYKSHAALSRITRINTRQPYHLQYFSGDVLACNMRLSWAPPQAPCLPQPHRDEPNNMTGIHNSPPIQTVQRA